MKQIAFLALFLCAQLSNAQNVKGKWVTYDDDTKKPKSEVEIYERDGYYWGKVIALFNRPAGEGEVICKKCSGDKKNKPVVGLNIVEKMKKSGSEFKGGTITDPANGKSYTCVFYLDPKDPNTLVVKGYVGPFNRAQYWKRAK
ncbi:MAG: DUF2147 domain-containing protein [Bacteroidales bacterium]